MSLSKTQKSTGLFGCKENSETLFSTLFLFLNWEQKTEVNNIILMLSENRLFTRSSLKTFSRNTSHCVLLLWIRKIVFWKLLKKIINYKKRNQTGLIQMENSFIRTLHTPTVYLPAFLQLLARTAITDPQDWTNLTGKYDN